MNSKTVIFALALAACACTQLPQNRTIEHPEVAAVAQDNLDLLRVDMTDSTTTLTFAVNFRPGWWIMIAPDSYIEADGQRYKLAAADGIVPGEEHTMSATGCDTFALVFPAVPCSTTTIDFSEGEGGWAVYGIDMTGRGRRDNFASQVPADARGEGDIFSQYVMEADSTELRFHIFGYRPEYGDKINVTIYNAFNGRGESFAALPVNDISTASLTTVLYGTSRVNVQLCGQEIFAGYVAPGGTTDIFIDPAFTTGKDGVYTADNGRYSAFNKALADLNGSYGIPWHSGTIVRYDATPEEYAAAAAMARMNAYADIDTVNADPAVEEYLKATADSDYLMMLLEHRMVLANAYMLAHQSNNYAADSLGAELPAEVFAASTVDLDKPGLRMAPHYAWLLEEDPARFGDYPGAAADHVFAGKFARALQGSLTEADLDTLRALDNEFYARAAALCQAATVKRLEELSAAVHPTPEVPADKLFDAIVAPYRGKVVLVDLWNTWCGPCRNALKANEPLKSGELANDDIVWLYIADTSSDTGLYASMIKNIKGEHYMVDKEQIAAIRRQFDVDGIPYYILVDRDGKAVGHPDFRDHSLLVSGIKAKL